MSRSSILEAPAWVEWRAGRLKDPVERLRYLRGATHLRVRRPSSARKAASLLGSLAILVAVVPLPVGTAEMFAKERRGSWEAPVAAKIPRVWLVEKSNALELYSNGLRIDLSLAVSNRPRRPYAIFSVAGMQQTGEGKEPVGIVYHTTESNLAPFEEEENHKLQRYGRASIEVVRHDHSYHYVIDRFGRVYRIVEETDAANHAGTSVWADARHAYINLNDSFIGVSFEGQTGSIDEVTPAQVTAGKVLTEMLRSRYGISAENCVTHAQVSINPQNMLIGSHTDWAGKFPFEGVGLPDNYSLPIASLYLFGFEYDAVFLRVTGTRWRGLDLAEMRLARESAAEGLETRRYRTMLQHRYKEIASALKEKGEGGS
jgi:hypothetical protein